uniref:myosin-11-like isoform X1 n=1 Tax=Monopterus albus TaxID=43700 RepID=UPI0009B3B768|nr:myosin-11-like isoform X1 [Monopterus albus]
MGCTHSTRKKTKKTKKRCKQTEVQQMLEPSPFYDRSMIDKIGCQQLTATTEGEFNNIKSEKEKLEATLIKAEEQQLNNCCLENNQLIAGLPPSELEERCSLQADLDKTQHCHVAHLEQQKKEAPQLVADLATFNEMAENERLQWKQEKGSLLDETEKCGASNENENNNLLQEKSDVMAHLKNREEQPKYRHVKWRKYKTFYMTQLKKYKSLRKTQNNTPRKARMKYKQKKAMHLQTTEELKSALQKKEQELERTESSMKAQLEQLILENNQLRAAQTEAQQLVTDLVTFKETAENERLQWKQEKASLLDEIEKCRASNMIEHNNLLQEKNNLMAALKNREEELECCHVQLQKDNTFYMTELNKYKKYVGMCMTKNNSLEKACMYVQEMYEQEKAMHLQITEELKSTLQRKEQEWEWRESSMKAHLEELSLENNQLRAVQKEAEQQKKEAQQLLADLETFNEMAENERLQWKQEKASLLDEIEKCKASNEIEHNKLLQEKSDVMAALKNREEELECCHVQLQKDNTFYTTQLKKYNELCITQNNTLKKVRMKYEQEKAVHLQTTEELKSTLQRKEQEWEWRESSMKAHLEELSLENNQLRAVQKDAEQKWQWERCFLQVNLDQTQRCHVAYLEQLLADLDTFKEWVENECLKWKQETASLLDEIEQYRASNEIEHNNLLQEKNDLMAELKNREEELECCHVQLEKDNTFYMTQLNKYKKYVGMCMTQINILEKACMNYEQEKAMHIQITEELKSTLQRKEQEWECRESSMNAQLEQLSLENNQLRAVQKEAEQQWQWERCSLQADLDKTQCCHVAHLEQQNTDAPQLLADLVTFIETAENERLQWKQEKASLLDEIENYRASNENENNNLLQEKSDVMADLKNREEQPKCCHVKRRKYKTFYVTQLEKYKSLRKTQNNTPRKARMKYKRKKAMHLQTTEELKSTLQRKEQELERTESSMEAQLEELSLENNQLRAVQKEAEQQWQWERCSLQADLDKIERCHVAHLEQQKTDALQLLADLVTFNEMAENERLQWKQEKASLLDETEKCGASNEIEHNNLLQEKSDVMADLKNREEQPKCCHVKRRKYKTFYVTQLKKYKSLRKTQNNTPRKARMKYKRKKAMHLQTTEELKSTLQRKEQELERTESSMEAQLEELSLENNQLRAVQKEAEQQWQWERCSLQADLDKIERCHVAHLEQQKTDALQLLADLVTFNKMAENERLQWKQEKASLLDETEKCGASNEIEHNNLLQEKSDVMADLKNREEQPKCRHDKWRKYKTFYMTQLKKYKSLRKTQNNTPRKARMKYKQKKAMHLQTTEELKSTL